MTWRNRQDKADALYYLVAGGLLVMGAMLAVTVIEVIWRKG